MPEPPEPLHADEALLAFDKPAGLLAVPGRGPAKADCLAARVQARHADARVVHRLDEATSGLMLFARGLEVQRALSRAFETRRIDKRYVAVVHGRLDGPSAHERAGDVWATIELPLAPDWPRRPRQRIAEPPVGKAAVTRWRVLAHDAAGDTTRLELQPLTGRSHQLRVHLLALGHPIVGDALYAGRPAGPTGQALAPRLLLHATSLAFAHPLDGHAVELHCPPPF